MIRKFDEMRDRPDADAPPAERRYAVTAGRGDSARLRVVDEARGSLLFEWSAEAASALMSRCPAARDCLASAGVLHVGKPAVRRLALAAAATARQTDERGDVVELPVARRAPPVPATLARIAAVLSSRRGVHLNEQDAVCLVALRFPALDAERIVSALESLAAARVIQRIEIPDGPVFYDADPRPHLHVYRPDSGTLEDAPKQGVVVAADDAGPAYSTDSA